MLCLAGNTSAELRRYAERNLARTRRLDRRARVIETIQRVPDDFAERGETGPMLKGDRFRVQLRGKGHGDETFARGFGSVRHVSVNS